METHELQQLALRTRSMREAGITLLVSTAILAVFLFVPLSDKSVAPSLTVATSTAPDAYARIMIEAKSAIVYDLVTHQALFEKNADAQLPLASLTKLLTVYAALSRLPPSTPITLPADGSQLEAPRLSAPGETLTLSDLARLTLTASLNDGAAAMLQTLTSTSNTTAVVALAGAAEALSLSQTYAVNGSGLDVSAQISGGYGSARDLAVLSGALVVQAPRIAEATIEPSATAYSVRGTKFTVQNTDPIVGTIPHLLLSKTGYTELADGNLALVFDVGIEHPIAVVVLGSSKQARFTDGSALVAATLAHFAGVASL